MEYTLDARVSATAVRADWIMHHWHDNHNLDQLARDAKEMSDRYAEIARNAIDERLLLARSGA
ncbi:MAG: hypothetical protein WAS05_09120 [Candidatus Nanopelagicales bacterium]